MQQNIIFIILTLLLQIDIYANSVSILVDGMEDAKEKDSQIGTKVWLNMVFNESGEKLNIEYIKSKEEALDSFISNKSSFLGINPVIYLENREKINPYIKAIYTFSPTPDNYIRYLLVIRKDSHIQNFKNLKNKTIGLEIGSYHSKLYLDYQLLKNKLPLHEEYFKKVNYYKNNSKSLMRLFFKKIDACIISEFRWKLMIEMNPQIEKKLKILDRSKKIFLSNLFIINNKIEQKFLDMHDAKVLNLKNLPKGKQILALLKADHYGKVDQNFLKPMLNFYNKYKVLKESKYGNR